VTRLDADVRLGEHKLTTARIQRELIDAVACTVYQKRCATVHDVASSDLVILAK
jgi:hypothetical protein